MASTLDMGTQRLVSTADRAWTGLLATGASPAILPIRLGFAVIFMAHGAQKLFGLFGGYGLSATGEAFQSMGFSPGVLMALLAGLIELGGGLLLALGLLTRVASGALALLMIIAAATVHWPNGFFLDMGGAAHGIEYNLALLCGVLATLLYGGGYGSLDRRIVSATRGPGTSSTHKTHKTQQTHPPAEAEPAHPMHPLI